MSQKGGEVPRIGLPFRCSSSRHLFQIGKRMRSRLPLGCAAYTPAPPPELGTRKNFQRSHKRCSDVVRISDSSN